MSVPPTNRSSSTPPSKGRPDESKRDKEFKLPPKKHNLEGKEGKEEKPKKKGLFDIASEETGVQAKQQGILQENNIATEKTSEISATESAAQVHQVGQLIQRMVETMRIGQIDGHDFASLELKKSPEVPEDFAGSNLTISYQENGIVIRFDNFMTPQQENNAITLVEKNKEQLQEMVQSLNTKNIQVSELSIGTHVIALPKVQPLPPPFQAQPATQSETEQQRDRRGGRDEGDQEQGGPR